MLFFSDLILSPSPELTQEKRAQTGFYLSHGFHERKGLGCEGQLICLANVKLVFSARWAAAGGVEVLSFVSLGGSDVTRDTAA